VFADDTPAELRAMVGRLSVRQVGINTVQGAAAQMLNGTEVCKAVGTCGYNGAKARLRSARCGGAGASIRLFPSGR
jgi:hypothetical protein